MQDAMNQVFAVFRRESLRWAWASVVVQFGLALLFTAVAVGDADLRFVGVAAAVTAAVGGRNLRAILARQDSAAPALEVRDGEVRGLTAFGSVSAPVTDVDVAVVRHRNGEALRVRDRRQRVPWRGVVVLRAATVDDGTAALRRVHRALSS